MKHEKTIYLDGEHLVIEDVINIAEKGYTVDFPEDIKVKIKSLRQRLVKQIEEHPEIKIYGTNMLHGDLKDKEVDLELIEKYQVKYMKVHNCGTGKPLPKTWVRAIMAIRLNSFAKNFSAMSWETCELMINMLNKGVTPWVLEEGSVGASGDLVPLAMIGAVMIGLDEAKAYYEDEEEFLSAEAALKKAGLEPVKKLGAKEAMGLTNGSNFIAAAAIFAIRDAELLVKNASISAALSVEAVRGEKNAFSEFINDKCRPHPGQIEIAKQMRSMVADSKRASKEAQVDFFTDKEKHGRTRTALENLNEAVDKIADVQFRNEIRIKVEKVSNYLDSEDRHVYAAHKEIEELKKYLKTNKKTDENIIKNLHEAIVKLQGCYEKERVQDRYSFRAVPQVHGPVVEAIARLREVVKIEINSATDNPLFPDDEKNSFINAMSGANFHGQPLAAVIDYVKITLTSLGLISDKRCFSLLDRHLSYGLPADLAKDTAQADGGLMILQYAGAARAAECRVLATPASIMSISTSANQEDFVSMGSIGCLHLHKIIRNVQKIIAVEIICAFRGIELTKDSLPEPLRILGKGTTIVYKELEGKLEKMREDMYLRTDLEKVIELVESGKLVESVADLLN
ncbi:MAG: aromatic amino acid ammonia-lyase [Acidobacteria bacterium]|jgi:histidine ammonia-lyase|nr:aromatic amino acid ammonia-lyase [Acidobacteriota bacterium]